MTSRWCLRSDELPILGMTSRTRLRDIASTLGLEPVTHRIDRMIKSLKIDIPAPRIA